MLPIIKSLAKNSIIYGIGNLSTKLVGFVLLPIYTQHLSVAEYGILGLMEVSLQVLVNLFGFGMTNAFYRWYWDKDYVGKQKSIFFTLLCFLSLASAAMLIVLVLFSEKLSVVLFNSIEYQPLLIFLSVAAALQIIGGIVSSLIQLQQRAALFTVANILQLAISLACTIYFVVYAHKKIDGIYMAQIAGAVFYFIILLPFVSRNITAVFEWSILKQMMRFSMPLMFSALSGVLIAVADRYTLRYFGRLDDVGIYSLGYKMANTIYVFVVMSINLAVSPMLYKMMDHPDNKRFYSKILTYYCFGIMVCVLGMSFFGKEIVKVMARNPDYWDAYKIIPIVSFAILFGALKDTAAIGLNITKKTHIISAIIIVISIANVALNILLVPILHTFGAAAAALISQMLFFGLIYFYAQRNYSIPYELRKIGTVFAVGLFLLGLASLSNDSTLLVRLSTKVLLLGAFPVLLYFAGFYEEIELLRLRQTWMKWVRIRLPK